jgi:hypothetical protein
MSVKGVKNQFRPLRKKSNLMPSAYIESTIPSYYVARSSLNLLQASRQASTRLWLGFWLLGIGDFHFFGGNR